MSTVTTEQRHEKVVAFVAQYRSQFNVGPSYAEIAKATGYASPSAARKAVVALCEAGRLMRIDSIARSIFVPDGK